MAKLLPIVMRVAACLLITLQLPAQDSTRLDNLISFPDKIFHSLNNKAVAIENKIDKQTERYLTRLQRQEKKLRRKVNKKDSTLAKTLFDGVEEKYSALKKLNTSSSSQFNKISSTYSSHLDSLATGLNLLKSQGIKDNPELQKALEQYKALQLKMDVSDQIKKYIAQRRELLKEKFEDLGMLKELKQFRKEVYYYQQQLREYKELFEDPSKIETKLMEVLIKIPQFKDFFQKNSMLGSMFALPGRYNNSNPVSFQGLQTRASINQTLVDQFGNGPNVNQMLQQNIRSAQGELEQLRNRLAKYSNGSYGNTNDDEIPGFKPNNQKTKSFLQRLEYGGNIQSQKARYFFPVTSDIALSVGYKINNKSTIGIGAAYKLGWGDNWNHIKLTHQGIGLRSYLDVKIKGSLYFSGGYEQNYRNMINSITQLQDYSAWQTSGLIGVSKKYSISKKFKGEMKLLWDFMSYQQTPRTQSILFRVGYSFK